MSRDNGTSPPPEPGQAAWQPTKVTWSLNPVELRGEDGVTKHSVVLSATHAAGTFVAFLSPGECAWLIGNLDAAMKAARGRGIQVVGELPADLPPDPFVGG